MYLLMVENLQAVVTYYTFQILKAPDKNKFRVIKNACFKSFCYQRVVDTVDTRLSFNADKLSLYNHKQTK